MTKRQVPTDETGAAGPYALLPALIPATALVAYQAVDEPLPVGPEGGGADGD